MTSSFPMHKDDVCTIYDDICDWYDQVRGKTLMERPYLDRALSLCPKNCSILDLGCGSAEPIGRYLIEQDTRYTGVDGSKKMLSLCQSRFPKAEWLFADMKKLDLQRTFDFILAWDSFFHLTKHDQRKMFDIFQCHAASSAILLFTSGPNDGEVYGEMNGHKMYHASLCEKEYRELLSSHGFKTIQHVVNDPTCGGHTVWLAQKA